MCAAVRENSLLLQSSHLCTCCPGGRLSSHAGCFWDSLIFGVASKDNHSRPGAGWREGTLKVGPLAVYMGRKSFGARDALGSCLTVASTSCSSCTHPKEKPVSFLAQTTDCLHLGLMALEWFSRDTPIPLAGGNLHSTLASFDLPRCKCAHSLAPSCSHTSCLTFHSLPFMPSLASPCLAQNEDKGEQHGWKGADIWIQMRKNLRCNETRKPLADGEG